MNTAANAPQKEEKAYSPPEGVIRCPWCGDDPDYLAYHDLEWAVPVRDDQAMFAHLCLETFQAGLNWLLVLKKRESLAAAFDGFNPAKIAGYGPHKIQHILEEAPGVIRNRQKVEAVVNNAQAYLDLKRREGSFSAFLWDYVNGTPIHNKWQTMSQVPAMTPASEKMSRDLKKFGFVFLGPTICYAHMQATGMVNDHLVSCFRHKELK